MSASDVAPAAPATVDDVAQACNITVRRVNQLAKDSTIPREARGEYNLGACMAAYIRHLQKAVASKGRMDGEGEITTTGNERAKLLRAQTQRAELENAKACGEVMAVADAAQILSSMIVEVKARAMAIGPRVAPQLVGQDSRVMIQAKIEAETKLALMDLSKSVPAMLTVAEPEQPSPSERSEVAAAPPATEPVPTPSAIPPKKRKRATKAAKKRARKSKTA